MYVRSKMFQSSWESWETVFQRAADFLTPIGPERTIGISQSQEANLITVTVWYWSDEPAPKLPAG
jgi:hypothetical protein